jgi:hypothetical protein
MNPTRQDIRIALESQGIDVDKLDRKRQRKESLQDNVYRPLARAAKTTAKGLAAPIDFANIFANPFLQFSGYPPLPSAAEKSGESVDTIIEALGGNPQWTQPQNFTERAGDTIGEFAGGGGAFKAISLASNAIRSIPKAAKTLADFLAPHNKKDLATLAGSGAGFQAAQELYPDNPIASLVGALIGGGAASKANPKSVGNIIAKGLGVNPEYVNTFNKAGLRPNLADVTDSRIGKTLSNIARETPFVGNSIENNIAYNAGKIAEYENALPRQEAGELAKQAGKSFTQRGRARAAELEDNMISFVVPSEAVGVNNTLDLIKKAPLLFTKERQKAFQKSTLGKRYAEIENIANSKALEDLPMAGKQTLLDFTNKAKNGIPFNDLRDIRQAIDNEITTFGKYGKKEQGALKKLRSAIKNDMQDYFINKSPEARKAFEAYNKYYTAFANKQEKIVNKLFANKDATSVFNNIVNDLKVEGNKAKFIMRNLPKNEKEVFSRSLIKELGSDAENEFKGTRLATQFKKLDDNAQNVMLMGFAPDEVTKFKNIIDAIDLMGTTADLANKSRTAYTAQALGTIGALWIDPFVTTSALIGGTAASTLLNNSKFINFLSNSRGLNKGQGINELQSIAKASPEVTSSISAYINAIEKKDSPAALTKEQIGEKLKEMGVDITTLGNPKSQSPAVDNYLLEKNKGS